MTSGTMPPATVQQEEQRDIDDLATGALANFLGKAARISRGGFIWVVTLLCGLEVQALYSLTWGFVSTLNKIGRFGLQRGVVRHLTEIRTGDQKRGAEIVVAAALRVGLLVSGVVTVPHLNYNRKWSATGLNSTNLKFVSAKFVSLEER